MPKPSSKDDLSFNLLVPITRTLSSVLQRFYFKARESVGHHKRDILAGRVELARDGLEEAKEQFQTALEKFSNLTEFDGGNLEDVYRQLKVEFDYSRSKALAVADRIDAVQEVAEALFTEWEGELDQYSNRNLRNASKVKLRQTQQLYAQLMTAMRRAEAKIDPVLSVFQDQVLFLKHNLNAKAISHLEGELMNMSNGVSALIVAMERSIDRANTFVETLHGQKSLTSD